MHEGRGAYSQPELCAQVAPDYIPLPGPSYLAARRPIFYVDHRRPLCGKLGIRKELCASALPILLLRPMRRDYAPYIYIYMLKTTQNPNYMKSRFMCNVLCAGTMRPIYIYAKSILFIIILTKRPPHQARAAIREGTYGKNVAKV